MISGRGKKGKINVLIHEFVYIYFFYSLIFSDEVSDVFSQFEPLTLQVQKKSAKYERLADIRGVTSGPQLHKVFMQKVTRCAIKFGNHKFNLLNFIDLLLFYFFT